MGIGRILKAKGESIELDIVVDSKDKLEKFELVPMDNEQFLEIQELIGTALKQDPVAQGKAAMTALVRISVWALNNGLPIDAKEEDKFTEEGMRKSSTPILVELFDKAIKINKLEKMFAFQQRSQMSGNPALSAPGSGINTLADLKKYPRVPLG